MKIYSVTAYRNGNRQAHSYPVGVFSTTEAAKACADTETDDRAGKYACFVEVCDLDVHIEEDPEEIYRTRSRMEEYTQK